MIIFSKGLDYWEGQCFNFVMAMLGNHIYNEGDLAGLTINNNGDLAGLTINNEGYLAGLTIYNEGYLAGLTINNEVCYKSHKVL